MDVQQDKGIHRVYVLMQPTWGCRVSTDEQVEELQAEVSVKHSR